MFSRFGIRARLLLAFVGISTFAVLGAAAALYSFFEVGKVLDRISRSDAPAAVLSLELSRQAERLVSAASAMLAVRNLAQLEQHMSRAKVEGERLNDLSSRLKTVGHEDSMIYTIDWTAAQIVGNLEEINDLVAQKLQLFQGRDALLKRIREATARIEHQLSNTMTEVEYRTEQIRVPGSGSGSDSGDDKARSDELTVLKRSRASLQQANGHVTTLNNIVLESQTADGSERLAALSVEGQIAVGALDSLIQGLDATLSKTLKPEIAVLRRSMEGNSSLFSMIEEENEKTAGLREVLNGHKWLSEELSGNVDKLVNLAKGNIDGAISKANRSQEVSTFVVAAVVTLSLICSILIVWLYVGRNIIARLTELSTAMESVAGGDLRIDLPDAGSDEIGRMVDALTVFRDTAIEIEENNLREIGQARQRLIDAIESISEGFCYFDADDKLIVANNRFRELMQTSGQAVKEGMTFETLVRNAAEEGYVEDAKGRIEEWIAERLERHRSPGPPHVQRRQGGQWIMISERRTGDGGTAAVYSDITEMKEREEELDAKSRSMEKLSNQIAKYLSPQVYESIFTGKQEVKVASHRRKLTVFFSDIEGFTETADQMESEDLTKILNHYLTEMTQIALAHGATIDKYVGDAIVIFFGDPETRGVKEDALACVRMAIAMRDRMIELQEIWRESGVVKPLQCRIGINTGFCTVGNFGSEDRMDYTIIGSGVNLASRLESAASPGEILLAYETYALVKDDIRCERKGELRVKGLAYPVETYEAIDSYDKLGPARELIREEHPNFHLKMDMAAMSGQQRKQAIKILGRTLRRLGAPAKGVKPGKPPRKTRPKDASQPRKSA